MWLPESCLQTHSIACAPRGCNACSSDRVSVRSRSIAEENRRRAIAHRRDASVTAARADNPLSRRRRPNESARELLVKTQGIAEKRQPLGQGASFLLDFRRRATDELAGGLRACPSCISKYLEVFQGT